MEKQAETINQKIEYDTIYRNIKYPRLEFRTGKLQVIVPKNYNKIDNLIETHSTWINNKYKKINNALQQSKNKKLDTNKTIQELKKQTEEIINELQDKQSIKINKIKFRKMKSKWASCSSNKNISLNTQMKYLPYNLIRYIVYHEYTHLKIKKHNKRFWEIISKEYPNYKNMENDLFTYWFLIQEYNIK